MAVSSMEHQVCRTRIPVSVDHIARRMIGDPSQVSRIVIDKMFHTPIMPVPQHAVTTTLTDSHPTLQAVARIR